MVSPKSNAFAEFAIQRSMRRRLDEFLQIRNRVFDRFGEIKGLPASKTHLLDDIRLDVSLLRTLDKSRNESVSELDSDYAGWQTRLDCDSELIGDATDGIPIALSDIIGPVGKELPTKDDWDSLSLFPATNRRIGTLGEIRE